MIDGNYNAADIWFLRRKTPLSLTGLILKFDGAKNDFFYYMVPFLNKFSRIRWIRTVQDLM